MIFSLSDHLRAFPRAKVQPEGFWTTPQLRHLALSRASIRRKCHEGVMSIVMKRCLLHMSHIFDLMISMTSPARPESISFVIDKDLFLLYEDSRSF